MTLLLLLWALGADPCIHGGTGAQCVTCEPSDRGTVVCRGICYTKTNRDGGYHSQPLKTEDKTRAGARTQIDKQAKEKCP